MSEHQPNGRKEAGANRMPWESTTGYRPDIDGLRAVAVLSVVFYHARLAGFDGGYVGVDIFFVISGYLITRIIHGEIKAGDFSIVRFYERRMRRIFPAIFVVLAASTALSLWLLFPQELKDFNFHLRGTLLFVSNFTLADETNYFGANADTQPLMHTWSLAVEEQFYLLFPLMMLATGRWLGGRFNLVIAAIAAISIAVAIWATMVDPAVAFFMPHVRAFELAAGALIAVGAVGWPRSIWQAQLAGLAGLALIIWALVWQSGGLPFPGIGAIPPVVGAALLIWSGGGAKTIVGRILALPPMVFIGLISYSLYLWHWPVFVFWPMWQGAELTGNQVWIAVAVSVFLATLSWRFVELPVRRRKIAAKLSTLSKASGIAVIGLVAVSLTGDWTEGLPQRFSPAIHNLINAKQAWLSGAGRHCLKRASRLVDQSGGDITAGACRIGDQDAPPTFILWGDSMAAALQPAIDMAAKKKHRSGYVLTRSACIPVPGYAPAATRKDRQCAGFNTIVLDYILGSDIDHVLMHGFWSAGYYTQPENPGAPRSSEAISVLVKKLTAAGKRVTLITNLPHYRFDPPVALARAARAGRQEPTGMSRTEADRISSYVGPLFDAAQDVDGVKILNPQSGFCDDRICRIIDGTQPLYGDDRHISPYGAGLIVDLFIDIM